MGKMKISKNNKKNAGMPSWVLSAAVIATAVIVALVCIFSIVNSTGFIPRMSTAMETDNFSINQNMMDYFYHSAYSTFVSDATYTSLKNYCSLNSGANTGLALDEQVIGAGTYDSVLAPNHNNKTWHDFFMDKAIANAKSTLVYCEEAHARNIVLDDADETDINANIEALILSVRYSSQAYFNMSDSACISLAFGEGVKKSDVEDALELMTLASKVQLEIQDELTAAITIDRITEEYTANPKEYQLVDYLNYAFDVRYATVSKEVLAEIGEDAKEEDHKDEILAEYKKQIAEAVERAEALSKITDKNEFIKAALTYFLDDEYQDVFDDLKEKQKLEDSKLPTSEELETIKKPMIEKLFGELLADDRKDTANDDVVTSGETFTVYGVTVTKEYSEFQKKLKEELYSDLITEEKYIFNEKSTYTAPAEDEEEDEDTKWLFADDRKEKDSVVIDEGDGENGAEVKVDKKYFTANVYCMVKPRYINEDLVRNGAYMVFTTKAAAEKAIAELAKLSSVDKEAFLNVATTSGAGTSSELTDYTKGQMGSDEFDEWMFHDGRVKGEFTSTPILVGTSSYIVAFFEEVGELKAWQSAVKYSILADDVTAEQDRITEKYTPSIIVKDGVMGRVGK
ncbi:MAG: hypothetical protein J6M03_06065 [Clostridia bacterium]|nr:hypothetical protein [Clostridia bacterium]